MFPLKSDFSFKKKFSDKSVEKFHVQKAKKETKQSNNLNFRRPLCAYDERIDDRLQEWYIIVFLAERNEPGTSPVENWGCPPLYR